MASMSARGVAAKKPGRDDLEQFMRGLSDPYHPSSNPAGYLVLLVAENKLSWPLLKEKMEGVREIPDWVSGYGDLRGEDNFRTQVAKMMEKNFVGEPVDKECIVAQAGAGSLIDTLCWCLAEEGDVCIIPAPMYSAFQNDLYARARIRMKPAHTKHPEYKITREILEESYESSLKEGGTPKILLICSPCNPTGLIYDEETLEMCVRWCAEKGIHLISDEIYGNSIFPNVKFSSVAKVCRRLSSELSQSSDPSQYLGDRVHVVSGFSKDFGISGMRVGILFSHNRDLLSAANNLTYFQAVSNHTQWILSQCLEDEQFMGNYLSDVQTRLYVCYKGLEEALAAIDVPLTPAQGTLMAWADFRKYLPEPTWEGEKQLWLELFDKSKILFTTGKSCQSEVPGFFRICYAWPKATEEDPAIAMKELKTRLVKHFDVLKE